MTKSRLESVTPFLDAVGITSKAHTENVVELVGVPVIGCSE